MMARRTSPPPPQSLRLSASQMQAAISRFRRRIAELGAFDPTTLHSRSDPRITILEVAIDEALVESFGHQTPEYNRYASAAFLNRASVYMNRETPLSEVVGELTQAKSEALALLHQAIRSLEEKLADLPGTASLDELVAAAAPR